MTCRHRSKPNIQKPKIPHDERRIFEAITAPILEKDLWDPKKLCFNVTRTDIIQEVSKKFLFLSLSTCIFCIQENKYEKFLIRNCKNHLESSKVLLVFQSHSLSKNDLKDIRNTIINKCGKIAMEEWNNEILRYVNQKIRRTKLIRKYFL